MRLPDMAAKIVVCAYKNCLSLRLGATKRRTATLHIRINIVVSKVV